MGEMQLTEGKTYTLIFNERMQGSRTGCKKVRKKMRLIKKYKYHAQFENSYGITMSFQYWKLERLMKGLEV